MQGLTEPRSGASFSQELEVEAHYPAADIFLWVSLNEKRRFLASISTKTVHLLRLFTVSHQEVQLPGALNKQTSSAKATERFDADSGVLRPCKDGFQDHPQGVTGVYPFYRPLGTVQTDLLHRTQIIVPHQTTEKKTRQ